MKTNNNGNDKLWNMHRKIQQNDPMSNGVPVLRLHCMQELLRNMGFERNYTEVYELRERMDETICGVGISEIIYECGIQDTSGSDHL